jgi:F-box protein 21
MYHTRIQLDRKALDLLDAIISQRDNRRQLAVQLANECGYDVWEAISRETTHVPRREFSNSGGSDALNIPIQGLTRQYWAREILGVISRCRALTDILLPLANPVAEDISFEKGLAALSAFFRADIDRVKHHVLNLIHLLNIFTRYLKNSIGLRSAAKSIY